MKQGINYFTDWIENSYPFVLIDAGAMGGIPRKWNCLFDSMKIIAFEPDTKEFDKLKSNNKIKYLNFALHIKSENLKYYITKGQGKSSIYKPNMELLSQYEDHERFQIIQEEIIPSSRVKNIDCICEENSIKDVDFIKLDTQGSEVLILQGGQRNLIPRAFGAQIEVEFVEMYQNQPLFRDVDEFMNSKGFVLIDLRRMYWKRKDYYNYQGKGELIFGDALYLKKIDIFYQELYNLHNSFYSKSKISKSILICMIYKLFDYAVALAKLGLEMGCFTNVNYEKIIFEITKYSRRGFFAKLHLNRRMYYIIETFLHKFRPLSYLGWADSDRDIANIEDI